ncbi:hypothetical protein FRC11_014198, partial [Ceratobasidium sp. 423]
RQVGGGSKGGRAAPEHATSSKRKSAHPDAPTPKRSKGSAPASSKRQTEQSAASKAKNKKQVAAKKRDKEVASLNAQAKHNDEIQSDDEGRVSGTPEWPIDEEEYRFKSDLKLPTTDLFSRTATNFRFVNERGQPCVVLPEMKRGRIFMIAVCGSLNGEYEGGVRLACGYWMVDVDPVKRAGKAPAEIVWLKIPVEGLGVETIDLMGGQPRDSLVVYGQTGHYILQSPDPTYHAWWRECRSYFNQYQDFQDVNVTGQMPKIFPVRQWWLDLQDEHRRLLAMCGADALDEELPQVGRAERQLIRAEIDFAMAQCTLDRFKDPFKPRIGYIEPDPLKHASKSKRRNAERPPAIRTIGGQEIPVSQESEGVADDREAASLVKLYGGVLKERRAAYEQYLVKQRNTSSRAKAPKGKEPDDSDSDGGSDSESDGDSDSDGAGNGRDGEANGGDGEKEISEADGDEGRGTQGGQVGQPPSSTAEQDASTPPPPPPPSSRETSRPPSPLHSTSSPGNKLPENSAQKYVITPMPHALSLPPPALRGDALTTSAARQTSLPPGQPGSSVAVARRQQNSPPPFNLQVVQMLPNTQTDVPKDTLNPETSVNPLELFGGQLFPE